MGLMSLLYQGVFKRTSTFTAAVCVGAIGVSAPPPPHLFLTLSSPSILLPTPRPVWGPGVGVGGAMHTMDVESYKSLLIQMFSLSLNVLDKTEYC